MGTDMLIELPNWVEPVVFAIAFIILAGIVLLYLSALIIAYKRNHAKKHYILAICVIFGVLGAVVGRLVGNHRLGNVYCRADGLLEFAPFSQMGCARRPADKSGFKFSSASIDRARRNAF